MQYELASAAKTDHARLYLTDKIANVVWGVGTLQLCASIGMHSHEYMCYFMNFITGAALRKRLHVHVYMPHNA